jgi:hypothetical protein
VNTEGEGVKLRPISLVARIRAPYAVFLRNFREQNAA